MNFFRAQEATNSNYGYWCNVRHSFRLEFCSNYNSWVRYVNCCVSVKYFDHEIEDLVTFLLTVFCSAFNGQNVAGVSGLSGDARGFFNFFLRCCGLRICFNLEQ